MRRWLVGVAWISTLAACGGGGGGGGSGGGGVSGTIGGQAFTPAGISAAEAGPATCPIPLPGGNQNVNVKAFALRFADFADVCTDLQSDPLCKIKASARTVTILFADIGVASTSPTLGAGTFTLTTDPTSLTSAEAHTSPSDPLVGTLSIAFGGVMVTGASCAMSTAPQVAEGTLRVDSVTPAITGSVNLTFGTMNGSTFVPGTDKLSGTFTAPLCNPISDICSLADTGGTCSTPTCT